MRRRRRAYSRIIGTVVLVVLVCACIGVGIARFGLPFRPRTRTLTAEQQRSMAEGLLPAAEEELRRQGLPESEIQARVAKLRAAEAELHDVEDERRRF